MKFRFLLFFLLSFFFENISLSLDSGNYLAGRYALSKKDYDLAINFFEKAIDINNINKEDHKED